MTSWSSSVPILCSWTLLSLYLPADDLRRIKLSDLCSFSATSSPWHHHLPPPDITAPCREAEISIDAMPRSVWWLAGMIVDDIILFISREIRKRSTSGLDGDGDVTAACRARRPCADVQVVLHDKWPHWAQWERRCLPRTQSLVQLTHRLSLCWYRMNKCRVKMHMASHPCSRQPRRCFHSDPIFK